MIKKDQTPAMFDSISQKYDRMNDIMTLGHHRAWKKHFVDTINPQKNEIIADLAAGTGDIAARLLKRQPDLQITLIDPSSKMLQLAQKRLASKANYTFASAEQLPFEDQTFDKVAISFGIRNTSDIKKALSEVHRVLKINGTFFCLEFSKPNRVIKPFYNILKSKLFPQLGALIAKDKNAYHYLSKSIDDFFDQEHLKQCFEEQGFEEVSFENLSFGVVAIHKAKKIK